MTAKKSIAGIVYGALDQVQSKTKQGAGSGFPSGARQCRAACGDPFAPRWWCNYQVPSMMIPSVSGSGYSLISAAQPQRTTMIDRLSGELMDAANNRGTAVKKREERLPTRWRKPTAPSRTTAVKRRKK